MNSSDISKNDIQRFTALPLAELMKLALQSKLRYRGTSYSLCSIMNAKSGNCSEDCSFCIQSSHYGSRVSSYPLKSMKEITDAAVRAEGFGAHHFSIVTSGRGPTQREVGAVAEIVAGIRSRVRIRLCASLGVMKRRDLETLKEAGISRYHHNIETSEDFFPKIVTTHTFADRLDTIAAAQEAGLEVCAGGILGLGENQDDRISMACTLNKYKVNSVPINILIPRPGTPLADKPPIPVIEIIRTIALFRLILPDRSIRLAAGREAALEDFLGMAFLSGADGLMIGGYLTRQGRPPEKDVQFIHKMKEIWTAS